MTWYTGDPTYDTALAIGFAIVAVTAEKKDSRTLHLVTTVGRDIRRSSKCLFG
jgi:hypothetical protein